MYIYFFLSISVYIYIFIFLFCVKWWLMKICRWFEVTEIKFRDHILTTVIAFSCSGLSDTSKIIITWMIVPTILEGRFSELKHKVWFSSQFCTNYPERAAVLDERLQVIKKGAVFLFVEWCVYWSLIIHYIILFVAFLPEFSPDGWEYRKLWN